MMHFERLRISKSMYRSTLPTCPIRCSNTLVVPIANKPTSLGVPTWADDHSKDILDNPTSTSWQRFHIKAKRRPRSVLLIPKRLQSLQSQLLHTRYTVPCLFSEFS